MEKLILIFCLLLSACSSGDLQFESSNGGLIKFSNFANKLIIINYWATWCKPCHEEIPELNRFNQKHKDEDAVVLGVSYDQVATDELANRIKKMGITFPIFAHDPSQALGIGTVPGLPTTFVFNAKGKLVKRLYGIQTEASLEKLLNKS